MIRTTNIVVTSITVVTSIALVAALVFGSAWATTLFWVWAPVVVLNLALTGAVMYAPKPVTVTP